MREMALSALRDADPNATSQSDPKRLPSRPNLLRKKRFAYRNSVARRRSRPEICKYVIDRVGSLGTANSPCLSTANSNCAQSVLQRGWPIRSANGLKRSCRPMWRAATAGLQRVGTIGTAQLLARPGVGSCMPRPHYLRPFAFVAGSMRRWHGPHLPFNLGLAGSATPFLKPAHSGPETHGTPASVADLCRSAALRLMLV